MELLLTPQLDGSPSTDDELPYPVTIVLVIGARGVLMIVLDPPIAKGMIVGAVIVSPGGPRSPGGPLAPLTMWGQLADTRTGINSRRSFIVFLSHGRGISR